MMRWKYKAITKTGNDVEGVLAGSLTDIKSDLSSKQYEILAIYPHIEWSKRGLNKISDKDIAIVFEDLYEMLLSGLLLQESIQVISETSSTRIKPIFNNILIHLKEGDALSQAFAKSDVFPSLVVSCIRIGEQSGRLIDVVRQISQFYHYKHDLKGRLFSACFYPTVIFIILFAVMLFISTKVIPQLKPLLPKEALTQPTTELLITFSNLLISYWHLIVGILLLILLCGSIFYVRNKILFEQSMFKVPFIGAVLKESSLALVFSQLSLMIKSGYSLIKALHEIHQSMPCYVCQHLDQCRAQLMAGVSFADALQMSHFFPQALIMSIRKAEQTVQWEKYLDSVSDYYLKRSQLKMSMLAHVMQPFFIVCGGGFLILVGLGFLLPIYGSLNKIAGG